MPRGPDAPCPAQGDPRRRLSLQVQLAETEAFSLNSDRSSSILLGDDLSLEDPTACPPVSKDSKVSGPGRLRVSHTAVLCRTPGPTASGPGGTQAGCSLVNQGLDSASYKGLKSVHPEEAPR